MNEAQKIQKELQKEVSEMVSIIDDIWILRQTKRFIFNMTKDTKYESLVQEKGGVSDDV